MTVLSRHVTSLRRLVLFAKLSFVPELLRSYRIAHSQIKPFERALQENTPLNNIKDPGALIEFLNQLKRQGNMAVQEMNRVTNQRDEMAKQVEQIGKELAAFKDGMSTPTAVKPDKVVSQPDAEKGDEGEDMFSYDDEIPKLQAELVSKNEKIASLTSEIDALKSISATSTLPTIEELATRLVHTPLPEISDVTVQAPSRLDIVAPAAEFDTLKTELEYKIKQLLDTEASLVRERSFYASTLAKRQAEIDKLSKSVATLSVDIEGYQKANLENKKRVEELTRERQSSSKAPEATEATEANWDSKSLSSATAPLTKKKNKRKKKGNATGVPTRNAAGTPNPPQPASLEQSHMNALKTEISKLKDAIAEKDLRISKLSEQVGHKAVLMEEIDDLRDNLVTIGQDHVEAKDRIKELEEERQSLQMSRQAYIEAQKRTKELEDEREQILSGMVQVEQQIASFKGISEAKAKLEADHKSMKEEFDKEKKDLQSDLAAAQKVSQERFKEITKTKDYQTRLHQEMGRLRGDSDKLKLVQAEVKAVKNELGASEKQEKELQKQLQRSQELCSQHESKIKLLNEQLSTEKASTNKNKNERLVLLRNYQRVEQERDEEITKAKESRSELEKVQSELSRLRPKVKELEDEVIRLQKEKNLAKEDLDLKTQQYNNAQGLIASMRDDKTELVTREKELKHQVMSLEEEVKEVQKLLDDRTREGETMRRMLAEANEQADVKVRDMRSQLEKATEERDQIEDESSNLARGHARENEALKNRTRELEHKIKTLSDKKEELETRVKEWLRRQEESGPNERKTAAENEDLRSAVSNLRTALDASEQQVSDVEKQKVDLRRLLDEARDRYERANKELRSVQSRLNVGSGPDVTSSGNNTVDLTRNSSAGSHSKGADANYLRGVFLQFLECKEEKVRSQLIPVLGKLLGFDKYIFLQQPLCVILFCY